MSERRLGITFALRDYMVIWWIVCGVGFVNWSSWLCGGMGELECRISIGVMGLIGLFLGFVMGYEFFGQAYGDGGMVCELHRIGARLMVWCVVSVLLLALAYDLYAVGLVLMARLLLFLDLGLLPYFVWYAFGWLYGVLRV